jgi:uncharacterized protein YdeI (YjbR/CyaY-like superfamily)
MEITETLYVADRDAWREWLTEHHATKKEIWLLFPSKTTDKPRISYLDAVEEALCFGWVDGIAKKQDEDFTAQRFTPRRPKSHWTELNKERVRRLIAAGKMTDAGYAVLPDMSPESFQIAEDILAALQEDETVWKNFEAFPDLYKRIRISYIEETRKQPNVFQTRLANFIQKTRANKQFGTMT